MTFKVNSERLGSAFSVPNEIVDKHLRIAGGEQIKVLLLILRKGADKLDENKIAKALKCDVNDVEDYLQYWINTGILLEGEEAPQPEKYVPPQKKEEPKPEIKQEASQPEYSRPSSSEIAIRLDESKELRLLFDEIQQKLGKTIGYDGQCTFLLLYDRFGLPADVIYMLVEYCVSAGKTGYSYIESVGKTWSEQEIDSIDKAAEKIAAFNSVDKFWKKFTVDTGVKNPKPTLKQALQIENWLCVMNMSYDMVMRAYDVTVENTGKISFSYMTKVLSAWKTKGYKKTSDIDSDEKAKSDAAKKNVSKETENPSYDLNEYTQNSIKSKLKYTKKDKK